jgi:hypothetical protein
MLSKSGKVLWAMANLHSQWDSHSIHSGDCKWCWNQNVRWNAGRTHRVTNGAVQTGHGTTAGDDSVYMGALLRVSWTPATAISWPVRNSCDKFNQSLFCVEEKVEFCSPWLPSHSMVQCGLSHPWSASVTSRQPQPGGSHSWWEKSAVVRQVKIINDLYIILIM